jgi:threonylcarbamoyladenosine tRNA methylthiotransferase MtaB
MLKTELSPFADLIITNAGKTDLFDFIENNENYFEDIENIEYFQEYNEALVKDRTRGFLKIQDGCDANCAYCIIPKLRGKPRSRNMSSVIEKFTDFVKNGYKEIVLVGIHIGKYGKDINSSLKELLNSLSKVEGDFRIRLSSLEVNEIDDELIDIVLNNDKFCPHFHIPLQSGSNKIIALMNRHYLKEEFIEITKKIKRKNPYATIGCDVIVGFPGETEKEFEETLNTVVEAGVNYWHVFQYSKRKNTPAFSYKMQGDEIQKKKRENDSRKI